MRLEETRRLEDVYATTRVGLHNQIAELVACESVCALQPVRGDRFCFGIRHGHTVYVLTMQPTAILLGPRGPVRVWVRQRPTIRDR